MLERKFDVVLYGATGYTGRLVADQLADEDASFAIAGRSRERLEDVRAQLDADPDVIVASVDDEDALSEMAARAHTVASAAGPFNDLGPPVLNAAVREGAHFVDTTGEQGFLRWSGDQHDRVVDADVAVVNACGFDVVPSDLAASTAANAVEDVESVDIALATNSRLSDGTKRTMAASTGDWWRFEDGEFVDAVPGRFLREFAFPDREEASTGVFIPWGDCASAPRSTGADNVRTFFVLPEDTARKYHRFWPVQALLAKLPFADEILEWQAPDDRGGPSPEDREDSWFSILAEATGADDETAWAKVSGQDPYGLTGAATARIALSLARDEIDERGVLTPTQAVGPDRVPKLLPEYVDEPETGTR